MRQIMARAAVLAAMAAAGVLATAQDATARERRGGYVGYVTAESRYGSGVVSGPVRQGPRGLLQVRLPGGTWMDCGRSCRETLRRETVDFWQSRNDPKNPYVDGPAYLTWRWWR
ncbi:MAG TPA: hypothetical protein PK970_10575 [Hyphomicrobiaceae bacterium]|nr:hypothetical protein [Hyphomicrobiaceae bacterium]